MNCLPKGNDIDTLQQRAIAIIDRLISKDAQQSVKHAVRQYNQIVREHIRAETGLRLSDEKGRGNVPIHIVDGFPLAIARLIDKYRDIVLWRLIMLQPKLALVKDGLNDILVSWDDIERWPQLPDTAKGKKPEILCAKEVAHSLQTLAITRDVIDELKMINEDILGAYCYSPHPVRIEIYWMAHALFAAAFDVHIGELAIVTLAHELAHAYTHVGRDIDSAAWTEPGFGQSDRAVIEGLAQYYTAVVTEKLSRRISGAFLAYQKLLTHQSGPYLAHESWFGDQISRQRGEIVRFAMLQARNQGKINDVQWRNLLDNTQKDLPERNTGQLF